MTIMLEVGDIRRFAYVGNFASYCRCVSTQRLSDGRSKGSGNRKKRQMKKTGVDQTKAVVGTNVVSLQEAYHFAMDRWFLLTVAF